MESITNLPVGLYYDSNFLDEATSFSILDFLENKVIYDNKPSNMITRQFVYYGYTIDYFNNSDIIPFPDMIKYLASLIQHIMIPNHCMIEVFNRGINVCKGGSDFSKRVGYHKRIDKSNIGDIVCCFTFGEGIEMTFQSIKSPGEYNLYTGHNTLLTLTDESRYDWTNEIKPQRCDSSIGITYKVWFKRYKLF